MEVYKFGGTSVGTADRIENVIDIISNTTEKIVVLSANGKSTDFLANIIELLKVNNMGAANAALVDLRLYYSELINSLFDDASVRSQANIYLDELTTGLQSYFQDTLTTRDESWVISRGELFSTFIFSLSLHEKNIQHDFLHATDIVHLDASGQPDANKINRNLTDFLKNNSSSRLIVTQGFLCSDHEDNVSTLGRGGSDYTAALLGAASQASSVQIWSDVDGFLNNDPGFVRGAIPLAYMSFDEAAELAYFGARVLHPATLHPAKEAGIPVILKNTLNPQNKGTVISDRQQNGRIKAVASKDNICSITIHSHRMLLAYGFLRLVFEVFENYKTSVDMVTTSEVSVSVTIDNIESLENILRDLSAYGDVHHDTGLSLVCVVGDSLAEKKGKVEEVFSAVANTPIKMISYGAAKNSISFLVDSQDKIATLESLNDLLNHSLKINNQYV